MSVEGEPDLHRTGGAPGLPIEERLPAGTRVQGQVVCRHGFGIGVRLSGPRLELGHVDWSDVADDPPGDSMPVGLAVEGVVKGYDESGMLRLSLRSSDLGPA